MEIGVDVGVRIVALGEPGPGGTFTIPAVRLGLRIQHTFQKVGLPQGPAIQVDLAGVMRAPLVGKPVAGDQVFVRIVGAEQSVRHRCLPHAGHERLPVADRFRTLDGDVLARSRLVDDSLSIRLASARWRHSFPVDPLMHRNDIARLRDPGRGGNRLERFRRGAVVRVVSLDGNMDLFGRGSVGQQGPQGDSDPASHLARAPFPCAARDRARQASLVYLCACNPGRPPGGTAHCVAVALAGAAHLGMCGIRKLTAPEIALIFPALGAFAWSAAILSDTRPVSRPCGRPARRV